MSEWREIYNDEGEQELTPSVLDRLLNAANNNEADACFVLGLLLFNAELFEKAEYYLSKAERFGYTSGELERLRRYSDRRNKRITNYIYSEPTAVATFHDFQHGIEEDGLLISSDKARILCVNYANQNYLSIPEGLICLCDDCINDRYSNNYSQLDTIVLPKSLEIVGSNVFNVGLKRIVSKSDRVFVESDALFSHNKRVLIKYFGNSIEYNIPGCVEVIHGGAFCASSQPRIVVIPESVVEIDGNPFYTELGKDIFVDSWSSFFSANKDFLIDLVDRRIVSYLGNNTVAVIPEGVENIGRDSFIGSPIESVYFPQSIKHINDTAFYRCPNLKTIHVTPNNIGAIRKILPFGIVNQVTLIDDYISPEYLFYSDERKEDSDLIMHYLNSNEVNCFYHFTDKRNLPSIKMSNGLYSWRSTINRRIKVAAPGGSDLSHQIDLMNLLDDYVHLSFCSSHPMAFRHLEQGAELVLFKINTEVACFLQTLFTDINSADKDHSAGGSFDDIKRIDINATKKNNISKDSLDFKLNQAEVLVKGFIPKEYIINFDDPIILTNNNSGQRTRTLFV